MNRIKHKVLQVFLFVKMYPFVYKWCMSKDMLYLFEQHRKLCDKTKEEEGKIVDRFNFLYAKKDKELYRNNKRIQRHTDKEILDLSYKHRSILNVFRYYNKKIETIISKRLTSLYTRRLSAIMEGLNRSSTGEYIYNEIGLIETKKKVVTKFETFPFRKDVAMDYLLSVDESRSISNLIKNPFKVERNRYICPEDAERWVILNLVCNGFSF